LTVFNAQPSRRKHSSRPTPSSSSLCTAACRPGSARRPLEPSRQTTCAPGSVSSHAVRWRLSVGQHIDSPVGDRVDDDGAARPSFCCRDSRPGRESPRRPVGDAHRPRSRCASPSLRAPVSFARAAAPPQLADARPRPRAGGRVDGSRWPWRCTDARDRLGARCACLNAACCAIRRGA
jgi:hypothetical protein